MKRMALRCTARRDRLPAGDRQASRRRSVWVLGLSVVLTWTVAVGDEQTRESGWAARPIRRAAVQTAAACWRPAADETVAAPAPPVTPLLQVPPVPEQSDIEFPDAGKQTTEHGKSQAIPDSAAVRRLLEKEQRYRRLQQRLQQIIESGASPQTPTDDQPAARIDAAAEQQTSEPADQPLPRVPSLQDSNEPPAATDPSAESLPPAQDEELATIFQAGAVVDGPVDRVALADNLYAIGEYLLALEMYRQTDTGALTPAELWWVQYQSACCLRKLGQLPEAQDLYRRLAGTPEAGWLNELSRWWLDRIADRAALKADLDRNATIINSLTQTIQETVDGAATTATTRTP